MSTSLQSFKSAISGDVLQPGDEGYDDSIRRWSPIGSKESRYSIYLKTTGDIATALKFAKDNALEIAVCGGGHSWSGASSTTGLLIHLGKYFNGVRCDPDQKLLYVGGGAVWETVDKEAIKHGLATVAGGYNDTGVGGLALGGGFGFLSGRHGLVVDNVVELTVVLASGEVVTANETSHPDLYWGCRGGGGNFGIVTEFVLRAHPQRSHVFLTRFMFPYEKVDTLINNANKWLETAGPDEMLLVGYFRMPPTFDPLVNAMYFYNGPADEGRAKAKLLYDVGPLMEMPSDELPFEMLNAEQKAVFPAGNRVYGRGQTVSAFTPQMYKDLAKAADGTAMTEPGLKFSGFTLEYFPRHAIRKTPVEATAFPIREHGIEVLTAIVYQDPSLDTMARDEGRRWYKVLNASIKAGSDISTNGYANYDPEPSRSGATLFGANYARLREVKRKYDPDVVFKKWFPIEPATA